MVESIDRSCRENHGEIACERSRACQLLQQKSNSLAWVYPLVREIASDLFTDELQDYPCDWLVDGMS
jgi:hypothetical protein